MPNWVFTTMSVEGNAEDIAKFSQKAGRSFMTYHKGVRYQDADGNWKYDADQINESLHEGPISFMNFATPADLDAYYGDAHGDQKTKPENYDSLSIEEKMAHAMKFSGDGWYDWNVRNWGTKWDACNAYLNEQTDTSLSYSFDTAWSPAEGAFKAMVEQHPELTFEFYCEEEQGWGVVYGGENGELCVEREWDIPDSHTDYVNLDREDSCVCGWEEDPEEWYADCPDRAERLASEAEKTQQEVAKFEDISEMIV